MVVVPQGSCLGSLLILIYINDLPYAVRNSVTSIYADDSTLFLRSRSINELIEAMKLSIATLEIWIRDYVVINCLVMYPKKSNLLYKELQTI